MAQRILLALDGTPSGTAAVDWALDWAGRSGGVPIGLAVIPEPLIRRPEAVPIGGSHYKARRDTVLIARARQIAAELLARFEARCTEAGIPYHMMERTGVPLTEITREAHGVDLVVVGRDTDFAWRQHGADRALGRLLRYMPRPVLAVPEHFPHRGPVLVVYDGSVRAARALYAFIHSGLSDQREVRLLPARATSARATVQTERACAFLQAHGIRSELLQAGRQAARSAADTILHVTTDTAACLLVLGVTAPSALRSLLGSSTARAVLRQTPVPVFLFG